MTEGVEESDKSDGFFHRTFNWELLRGFGQSSVATVSLAMPFVGYAILYHSQIETYIDGLGKTISTQEKLLRSPSEDQNSILEVSLFTKLNLIYLGSFLIGLGTVVFRIFAPKAVKEATSISDYAENELGRATARCLRSMINTIQRKRPSIARELTSIAPWLDKKNATLKTAYAELQDIQRDQLQNDVLSSFYNIENRYSHRWAVYLTVVLYVVGFFLLSIPGVLFTLRVLRVSVLSLCT